MKKITLFAAFLAGAALQSAAQTQVLYMPFDGSLANKVAGGNAGVLRTLSSETYVDGKFGQAFDFPAPNGVYSNAIDVAHYEALKLTGKVDSTQTENEDGTITTSVAYLDPAGSFSVSLWIKTDGTQFDANGTKKAYLFHSGTWGSAKNSAGDAVTDGDEIRWTGLEFQGTADGANKLVFCCKQPNGKKQELYFTDADDITISSILDGNWHHIVAVRDHENQVSRVYVDAVKAYNSNASVKGDDGEPDEDRAISKCYQYPMAHEAGLAIGNSRVADVNDEPYVGALDELRVFQGALTDAQIQQLFESNTLADGIVDNAEVDAISRVCFDKEIKSVEHYSINGTKVSADAKGMHIVVYTYTDGTKGQMKSVVY